MFNLEISEARTFVNHTVNLTWTDRKRDEIKDVVQIFGVEFLPLYGPCLITNTGEIRLDRVKGCVVFAENIAA